MTDAERQKLISRVFGLYHALEITLRALVVKCGPDARTEIAALRDEAVNRFKNSDISPEREMEHADIVGPAIDAINLAFDGVLRDI